MSNSTSRPILLYSFQSFFLVQILLFISLLLVSSMYRCFYSSSFSDEYWQLSSELFRPYFSHHCLVVLRDCPVISLYSFSSTFYSYFFSSCFSFSFLLFLLGSYRFLSVCQTLFEFILSSILLFRSTNLFLLSIYFLSLLGVSAIRNAVDIQFYTYISILFSSSFTV